MAAACERLRQQLAAGQPVAAVAGAHSRAEPAAAEPPSGRPHSAKPRRRGRSVPEEETPLIQDKQPGHRSPADASVTAAAAASEAHAPEEKAQAAADAAVAAQVMACAAAAAAEPDGAAPITPEPAEYDSDWEARVRPLLSLCVSCAHCQLAFKPMPCFSPA